MNIVMMVGRLVRDPELRYTNNGKAWCRFSIAVDRPFSNKQDPNAQTADFFNIVAWDKQAETIATYITKGRQIAIQGRLQTGTYKDQTGQTRYSTDVMLEKFDFIGSNSQQQNQPQQYQPQSQPQQQYQYGYNNGVRQAEITPDYDYAVIANDEDVPF